jgi:hypothetical protein
MEVVQMKKRIIFGVAMAVLLICATANAQTCVSSGSKTASALIVTDTGSICGIAVSTDGTNAQTVDAYDAVSATGTKLIPTWVVTTSSTDRTQTYWFMYPVSFTTGLYVNVSGSGTMSYVIYYKR